MAKNAENICNMALSHLGLRGSSLTDMTVDQTEAAENCVVFYETARDFTLSAFPWPFALARATLAERSETREGWAHVFSLPQDCVQPRTIWPVGGVVRNPSSENRVPFDVERADAEGGQVLVCDLESPVLFYTARVEDVTRLSAPCVLAMSYKLAELLALPLTGDKSKRDAMRNAFYISLSEAAAVAMNGRQEDQLPETPYLAARR